MKLIIEGTDCQEKDLLLSYLSTKYSIKISSNKMKNIIEYDDFKKLLFQETDNILFTDFIANIFLFKNNNKSINPEDARLLYMYAINQNYKICFVINSNINSKSNDVYLEYHTKFNIPIIDIADFNKSINFIDNLIAKKIKKPVFIY